MNKPVIIAICGKSASGKDSVAKGLRRHPSLVSTSHLIVSDTTRTPRSYEVNDLDYHFITIPMFLNNIFNNQYLEHTCFKGWRYGTNKKEICYPVNIGVFNPEGLRILLDKEEYNVVPVLLKTNFKDRLLRSWGREEKWSLEYFRRAWQDHKDFSGIEELVNQSKYGLVLINEKTTIQNLIKRIVEHYESLNKLGIFM